MGYVPTGALSPEGARYDVSGRQHRGTRAGKPDLSRREVGRLGEEIAAFFLRRRHLTVTDRNLRVGRGELDLLAVDKGRRVVVEVKTIITRGQTQNAEDAFTQEKAATVARLAGRLRPPVSRIDLIAVWLSDAGADIRWLRDVA